MVPFLFSHVSHERRISMKDSLQPKAWLEPNGRQPPGVEEQQVLETKLGSCTRLKNE